MRTVFGSEAAELHQTGFLRVNRESELPQSALHGYTEAPGIVCLSNPMTMSSAYLTITIACAA